MASLLGTGVMLTDFFSFLSWSELDFVVSCRHEAWGGAVLVGVVVVDFEGPFGEDLAKKPRILCCFRVVEVEAELGFLDSVGVFAGVCFSPMMMEVYTRA